MKKREQRTHTQEQVLLQQHRVSIALLLGGFLLIGFSLLDYVAARHYLVEFLGYRLLVSGFCFLLYLLLKKVLPPALAQAAGFMGYLAAVLLLLVMIHRLGGVHSGYYAGLVLVLVFYLALTLHSGLSSLLFGAVAVVLYLVTVTRFSPFAPQDLDLLVHNVFFLCSFVLLAAIVNEVDKQSRRKEYALRMEAKEATDFLAERAAELERQIKRKTAEQKGVEERYRLLFDNLTDNIVLLDGDGGIRQANVAYLETFGTGDGEGRLVYESVAPELQKLFHDDLVRPLLQGEEVVNYHTRMVDRNGNRFDAEISGSQLDEDGRMIGLQLLIRDITHRRVLADQLVDSLTNVKKTENATILALAKLSEYRDTTTGNHLERIREYCRLLADHLGRRGLFSEQVTDEFVQNLYIASILHDVGKVGIPDVILRKNGLLTQDELSITHQHTLLGGDVIKSMELHAGKSPFLAMAKSIAYFHHERWDGSGYPQSLQGEEIPLSSRIMAVADTYDGLTTYRSYGKKVSHEEALKYVVERAGVKFDPRIIDSLIACSSEFDTIRRQYSEGEQPLPA